LLSAGRILTCLIGYALAQTCLGTGLRLVATPPPTKSQANCIIPRMRRVAAASAWLGISKNVGGQFSFCSIRFAMLDGFPSEGLIRRQ